MIGKISEYINKKGCVKTASPSIQEYIGRPIAHPKGRGRETKTITCPHLEPSQSIKLTREIDPIFIDALDQDHKLHTKEYFILWIQISAFSNASKFLSFHTIQKYIGEPPSMPSCGLYPQGTMPPKECLLNRGGDNPSQTKERKEQLHSEEECDLSPLEWQRKHLFANKNPFLWA